ncbi:hypothetical protein TNCV_408191 [Trichonephila clavipes]|nr:hypothetical protein TNCV_408191 [Trichonephila clavipes]
MKLCLVHMCLNGISGVLGVMDNEEDDERAKNRRVKSCLKGIHFTSIEDVLAKTENLLKGLSKISFQDYYLQWNTECRSM